MVFDRSRRVEVRAEDQILWIGPGCRAGYRLEYVTHARIERRGFDLDEGPGCFAVLVGIAGVVVMVAAITSHDLVSLAGVAASVVLLSWPGWIIWRAVRSHALLIEYLNKSIRILTSSDRIALEGLVSDIMRASRPPWGTFQRTLIANYDLRGVRGIQFGDGNFQSNYWT